MSISEEFERWLERTLDTAVPALPPALGQKKAAEPWLQFGGSKHGPEGWADVAPDLLAHLADQTEAWVEFLSSLWPPMACVEPEDFAATAGAGSFGSACDIEDFAVTAQDLLDRLVADFEAGLLPAHLDICAGSAILKGCRWDEEFIDMNELRRASARMGD